MQRRSFVIAVFEHAATMSGHGRGSIGNLSRLNWTWTCFSPSCLFDIWDSASFRTFFGSQGGYVNKVSRHLWREGTVNMHRRTHTKSKEHKDKQHTHTEAGKKNSGAQQWLCTRSAYTIFHHYCGEKTLNYWSAPLLPFLSLSLSLSHPLSDSGFYSCFNFSLFTSLTLSEICKRNKTLLKWIPVVNKIINMRAPLRNHLHRHQTLTHIRKKTNTHTHTHAHTHTHTGGGHSIVNTCAI